MPRALKQWEDPNSRYPEPETHQDWANWIARNRDRAACTTSMSNPAWINPLRATDAQIEQAQRACAACPLLMTCDEWASTTVYEGFEGVLAGRVVLTDTDTLLGAGSYA